MRKASVWRSRELCREPPGTRPAKASQRPPAEDAGGTSAGDIDIATVVGPATCLDLTARRGPQTLLGVTDLETAAAGLRGLASILLLHTGWSTEREVDPAHYFGNSMGIDREAAVWVRAAGVRCIGIDAPSIDTPRTPGAPAHMEFLRGKPVIYVIENLRGLDQLPRQVPLFMGAPLRFRGATGSPIRALAMID